MYFPDRTGMRRARWESEWRCLCFGTDSLPWQITYRLGLGRRSPCLTLEQQLRFLNRHAMPNPPGGLENTKYRYDWPPLASWAAGAETRRQALSDIRTHLQSRLGTGVAQLKNFLKHTLPTQIRYVS